MFSYLDSIKRAGTDAVIFEGTGKIDCVKMEQMNNTHRAESPAITRKQVLQVKEQTAVNVFLRESCFRYDFIEGPAFERIR